MEGRFDKAKRNIVYGLLANIVIIILEFVSRFYFIKYLGEELLGINGVFTNIIQVLSLAELGLNNVVNYSFYEPFAKGDKSQIAGLVAFYRKVYNCIAIVVFVLGLLIMPFLEIIVDINIAISSLRMIYFIFLLDTSVSYLFVYKHALITADQKSYIKSKLDILSNIIRTIVQIIAIIVFRNIIVYLFTKTFITFLTSYLLAVVAEEKYPFIKNEKKELSVKEKERLLETIKSGFIYKLSAVLLNSTDNILISTLVGTIWVGYLLNYISIQTGLSSFYTIVFTSLIASIGNMIALATKEKNYEIFNTMNYTAAWMATVFASCFFVLSTDFITLWLGNRYVLSKHIVLAKSLMLYLSCSMNPVFSFREAMGLYKKTKYSIFLAALINIALSIWWGKIWGVAGILYASIVAILVTYYWYEPLILYRDFFKISFSNFIKSKFLQISSFLILMYMMDYVSSKIVVKCWGDWLIKAMFVFVACNLIYFLIHGREKEFLFLKNKVLGGNNR